MSWLETIWHKRYADWTIVDGLLFSLIIWVAYFIVWFLFLRKK